MIELTRKEDTTSIEVLGVPVIVKQSISTETKYSIAATCIEGAIRNGVLVRNIFESSLYALMVLTYSDFEYANMGTQKISDVFDILDQHGIIEKIKNAIPEEEFRIFIESANDVYNSTKEYLGSINRTVETLIEMFIQGGSSLQQIFLQERNNTNDEIVPLPLDKEDLK